MTPRKSPHAADRARDELCLYVLQLWEQGWSGGDISGLEDIPLTRSAVVAIVHRIHKADPRALVRHPERAP